MKKLAKWVFRYDVMIGTIASLLLIGGSWSHYLPLDLTEVFGFVSGAICVWLTVKENIWNWPIGIANDIFFIILFFSTRLYADMSLQVVYIILGFLGWYWWLHGGNDKTELPVSKVTLRTSLVVGILVTVSTYGMMLFLRSVHDAAPFLDALTTVLSLAAQYLLTRKLIENWYIWITADIIYIGLYATKNLYLTSVLYFIFLCMCIAGLREWQKSLKQAERASLGGLEARGEEKLHV